MHPVFIDGTDLSKYEQAKRRFIDANETCRVRMSVGVEELNEISRQ